MNDPYKIDERRFKIWTRIHELRSTYSVDAIAKICGQTSEVVNEILSGIALNRIRLIRVAGSELTLNQDSVSATRPQAPEPLAETVPPCDILAIDFLNLLVRAYHVGRQTETHAVRSMFRTVANAVRTVQPKRVVFCLDGGHDHRSELMPDYKAHRPPSEPLLRKQKALAEKAIDVIGLASIRMERFEADDVAASIARQNPETVIASSDKDLLALSGVARILHPWSGGNFVQASEKLGVTSGQVTDYLALCGDASDGVPGVKGIGPKTAVRLLNDHGNLEAILLAAKTSRIAGSTGRKLAENLEDAILSRRVIELVDSLELPEIRGWMPSPSYANQLHEMGLGAVADVMEPLRDVLPIDERPKTKQASSQPDALQATFAAGQRSAKRADPTDNPYRKGTEWHNAWQAGYDGDATVSTAETGLNS